MFGRDADPAPDGVGSGVGPDVASEGSPRASSEKVPAQSRQDDGADGADGGRHVGLRLLLHVAKPRASRGQVLVAVLCGLLGFALVTQVHSQATDRLSSARQSDLVDVLDNLSTKSDQLQAQINQERETLNKLTGGAGETQAALEEAQQRANTLRILAGTIGAAGPGIDLRINDPDRKVTADVLLDALEELRDAGAEAVEIRNEADPSVAVRLVASSYFLDAPGGQGVLADGVPLTPPYDILAIGDPSTMAQAMAIPGGVLDTLKGNGASGKVSKLDAVQVTALHASTPPQYARPAASPTSQP